MGELKECRTLFWGDGGGDRMTAGGDWPDRFHIKPYEAWVWQVISLIKNSTCGESFNASSPVVIGIDVIVIVTVVVDVVSVVQCCCVVMQCFCLIFLFIVIFMVVVVVDDDVVLSSFS